MTDTFHKPLSPNEIRGTFYHVVAATGSTNSNWKPGAIARTLISACSIVLAGLSAFISLLAGSAFLPFATGEWLRLLAVYVYGVVRVEATFATGSLTLTNAGVVPHTVLAGALSVRNPTTHKLYTNLSDFTLAASSSLAVVIAAIEQGSASTSFVGEITELVSPLANVTCANASPVIGADVEGDAEVRARCRAKLEPASPNGPNDAYRHFAVNAKRADGSPIGVTRVRAIPAASGNVAVYLASADGAVSSSDVAVIDDLFQRNCVPLCVMATTASAVPVVIPLHYRVWLYNTSGLTAKNNTETGVTNEIAAAIASEVVAYFASMPIGGDLIPGSGPGKLHKSELSAVIGRARKPDGTPLRIVRVEVDLPADDVELPTDAICLLAPPPADEAQAQAERSIYQVSAVSGA